MSGNSAMPGKQLEKAQGTWLCQVKNWQRNLAMPGEELTKARGFKLRKSSYNTNYFEISNCCKHLFKTILFKIDFFLIQYSTVTPKR